MTDSPAGRLYAIPLRPTEDEEASPGRAPGADQPPPARTPRQQDEFETLLYHITHDLRAAARPMTIVPGWIREDLTREGVAVPPGVEESLQTLETHAARLERMLVDLRTFSRIGRLSDAPAPLDLETELDAVLEKLPLPAGFTVTRRIEAPTLTAPRNELRLLLSAVLDNACKHHDRESGRITVSAHCSGGRLRISVIDDGPGIERRYRDAVFKMMTTLRPRDEIEGSGLGLSIARKIVTRLGGSIEIADPLAPRGTCVVIDLPQT